jgi:endoglucanase
MKPMLFFMWIFPMALCAQEQTWIRINQLGYPPHASKAAVYCSKQKTVPNSFELIDTITGSVVYVGKPSEPFGEYGPFTQTLRLDFSAFTKPGHYKIRAGNSFSPVICISDTVYKAAADFCLQYMRQQRSGFNPFLNDSCHTHDGYTLYGPMPDSTHIDVSGGWHDASDYLQYSTTSANATFHLLAAYRDFPHVFTDEKMANGLEGKNGLPDVLDEAKWGLEWLQKMFPRPDWMFNQVADDRDHRSMRIPKEDSFYGRGFERPVYFLSGEPQQRGKFMNATTGTASTAGKFASAFALAAAIRLSDSTFNWHSNKSYAKLADDAYLFGRRKPGVAQTASVRSPYIYAEENWSDDMELAAAQIAQLRLQQNKPAEKYLREAMNFARLETITPWFQNDTAKHYQWYPFINIGHQVLADVADDAKIRDSLVQWYRDGIEQVWQRAKKNAFYRGIPFIWCSNNLTVSFAIQCYWYSQLTAERQLESFAQANVDWLFGCNPWGISMVYGLPAHGTTAKDPHSAFTHLKNYPINGGLVDGPVYTSIYESLIGIQLNQPDEYAAFQSKLAVYHDDYGDYSTNEPTMDGTASLIYLLAAMEAEARNAAKLSYDAGAIMRGDSSVPQVAIVFTADSLAEGLPAITKTLQQKKVKAAFFLTGNCYRNPQYQPYIQQLAKQGHLMGLHSDRHLLYCSWQQRDSVLVSKDSLLRDLDNNIAARKQAGINTKPPTLYIPPYEWWNDTIAGWIQQSKGWQLFSFTPGVGTHADYTFPEMGAAYKSNETIWKNIRQFQQTRPSGLNGAILLIHAGADPRRKEKFYQELGNLIDYLRANHYAIVGVDEICSILPHTRTTLKK